MFSIISQSFGKYSQLKIVNTNTGEFFSFFPDYGATMNQLALKNEDGVICQLLDENINYQDLITEGKSKYKGSKLFPFPNRIDSGSYSFDAKNYQLPINEVMEGHSIHGLLSESSFQVIDKYVSEEEGIVAVNYFYDNEKDGYPFKFKIKIVFALSNKGFSCKTVVKNVGLQNIPVGDGWHPYFKINNAIEDLYLSIPSYSEIEVNEKKIPTGKIKYNSSFKDLKKIGADTLDTCFKLTEGEELSLVKLVDKNKGLNVAIWLKSPYKYVQVYTPPSRSCIAIEPMTCMPDVFNNKEDLIIIPPNHISEFEWGINLF